MIQGILNGFTSSTSGKKELENFLHEMEEQIQNWVDENEINAVIGGFPDDIVERNNPSQKIKDVQYNAFLNAKSAYEDFLDDGKPSNTNITSVMASITSNVLDELSDMKFNVEKLVDETTEFSDFILAADDLFSKDGVNVEDTPCDEVVDGFIAQANEYIAPLEEIDKNLSYIMADVESATTELAVINFTNADIDLKNLSKDDLVNRFVSIGRQAQLQQGLILLELRSRFPSDKEFGQWISTSTFCASSHQQRTRLMNFAKFFGNRDMNGISLSVAYEISAPKNAEVAEELYERVYGQFFTVEQIVEKIENLKNEKLKFSSLTESEDISTVGESESESEIVDEAFIIDIDGLKKQLLLIVAPVPIDVVKTLFKDCVSELKIKAK